MKISCQSCQAKYTIADEKVVGKIVKIRCKKCGATIVINGNEDAAAAAVAAGGVADYTGASDEQWTVNVAEGDQRTMSLQELVQEYKSGVVTDDTYCWKDGMNDWLPLHEIETLYSAATLGPAPALHTNADGFSPISLVAAPPGAFSPSPPASADPETVAGANFGLFGGSNGAENTRTDVSNGGNAPSTAATGSAGSLFGSGNSPPAAAAAAAAATGAAARRIGGRGTGNADLFGGAAQAGGENDVLTSAAGAAAGGTDASKMTGARNENSVLFSLNALTTEPSKPGGGSGGAGSGGGKGDTTATTDGSGLIDIRALAQSMGVENNGGNGNAKVDDIMNLSGGGAFSAALASPVLAPAPADYSADAGSGGERKSKTTLYAILGGAAFLGVCILGAAFMFSGGKDKTDEGTKTAPTTTETVATPTNTVAAADTNTPPSNAQPPTAGTTQAVAPTTGVAEKPAGGAGTKPLTGTGKATSGATGGGAVAAATPDPTPPPAPKKPGSLAEEMTKSVGEKPAAKPAEASGGGTAPFDRGAASAALSGVAVQACKKPDGPTGAGKVKVTFEPNGSVSKVEFAEGPYGGTPVGGCILGKFRNARIPAFSGAAVTAGKSFFIN